jgi:hypothetical protein
VPGMLTGSDDFTSTTAGGNLNGRVPTAGGTWATSGVATDFQFADDLSGEQVKRSTASEVGGRFAILGASTYTNTEVSAQVRASAVPTGGSAELGVVGRWVNSSNYLSGRLEFAPTGTSLYLLQLVAGSSTLLNSATFPGTVTAGTWYALRLVVFSSGRAILTLLDSSRTTTIQSIEASASALGAGGALDDGGAGLFDNNGGSAVTRYYDDFSIAVPPAEPVVINPGQSMQITSDDVIREDATGTYYGRPPTYRGSRFLVPAGTSRVLAKANRNDVDTASATNVTDATQIQVGITPRGLAVPRA